MQRLAIEKAKPAIKVVVGESKRKDKRRKKNKKIKKSFPKVSEVLTKK